MAQWWLGMSSRVHNNSAIYTSLFVLSLWLFIYQTFQIVFEYDDKEVTILTTLVCMLFWYSIPSFLAIFCNCFFILVSVLFFLYS